MILDQTVNFDGEELTVDVRRYNMRPGNPAIQLYDADGSPYLTASVNLPDKQVVPDGCIAIKDYSENAGIAEALQSAGIIGERVCYMDGIPIYRLLVQAL